jgi:hypothetical protein
MNLKQFTTLYNERRQQEMGTTYFPKKFSLEKSKVTKKSIITYEADEHQRPIEVSRTPTISKRVFDINGFHAVCQAVWKYYLGTELKRISSEGSYRKGIGYIKSPNKGISDLMGAYQGRVYFIESKQAKEKQLDSQIKFQQWTEDGGVRYCIVRNFDEIYNLVQEIMKRNF